MAFEFLKGNIFIKFTIFYVSYFTTLFRNNYRYSVSFLSNTYTGSMSKPSLLGILLYQTQVKQPEATTINFIYYCTIMKWALKKNCFKNLRCQFNIVFIQYSLKSLMSFLFHILNIAPVFTHTLQESIITFSSPARLSHFTKNEKFTKTLIFSNISRTNNRRNFLISCWNTTIRAKKPTLINLPNKLLNTVMFNKSVNFQIRYIITIPIKIFI